MALAAFGRNLRRRNFFHTNMYLHKNRKYSRCPSMAKPAEEREKDPCPSKNICPKKPRKKSFWKRLFESEHEEKVELPPDPSCCKKRHKDEEKIDPDLSQFGGQPYKTCGVAYLVQKDILSDRSEIEPSVEQLQIRKIEADLALKDTVNEDPLGVFKSTELRLLELSDKKLHPLYKKYGGMKKRYLQEQKKTLYKTISWPIDMHEIPARLNINADIVEKKNMEYMEFKRIEPPRQLIERVVELEINARPTMEAKKKVPVDLREVEKRQHEDVSMKTPAFDTLNLQRGTKY